MTMEIEEAFERITAASSRPDTKDRMLLRLEHGQHIRQGDISVTRLPDFPDRALLPSEERQLAPGNTMGSRHQLHGEVEIFTFKDATALEGPVFRALDNVRIGHPTHADIYLPCEKGEVYQVTFQQDKAAEEIRRPAD